MEPAATPPRHERDIVWCLNCGIPYPANTLACSHCGQLLAPAPGPDTTTTLGPSHEQPVVATVAGATTAPLAPVRTLLAPVTAVAGARLTTRASRRPAPASEAEIDAAAAAIVARALELTVNDTSVSAAPAAASSPDVPSRPIVTSGMTMAAKDRVWLVAGVVLCILLVILAAAFARYLATSIR